MNVNQIVRSGRPLDKNSKVLVMLHGRGSNAQDILSLADHLEVPDFTLIAPNAANHTWYPYTFLAPPSQNEPSLSASLQTLEGIVTDLYKQGLSSEQIYFTGFSQGACLMLEFAARNATKYGGIAAFTGGLIGDKIYQENYHGDFEGTPIFIGTGNPDAHVPVDRVNASVDILERMNAQVTKKVYAGRPHTITLDEIREANELIFAKGADKVY